MEADDYEIVITARFSGEGSEGRKVFHGMANYLNFPGEPDGWKLEARSTNRFSIIILRPLLETLWSERETLRRIGVVCSEIQVGYFNRLAIATLQLESFDVNILSALKVPLSLQLALFTDKNKNKNIRHGLFPNETKVVVGINFSGFQIDPESISRQLDMEPVVLQRIGDRVHGTNVHNVNRWYAAVESCEHSIDELIIEYTEFLKPNLPSIAEMNLKEFVGFRVGVFQPCPPDDCSIIRIETKTITAVADFGAGLTVALYFHDCE